MRAIIVRVAAVLALALTVVACGGEGRPSPPPALAQPVDATNRWARSAPAAQGMDEALLRRADRFVRSDLSTVSSLLVVRHGRLVFERYYGIGSAEQPAEIYSVTKSVVSALVGIAVERGELRGGDQKLVDLLPKDEIPKRVDRRVRTITLRDMLTMSAGFEGDDAGFDYTYEEDWARSLVERPLVRDPGRGFAYDSGSSHLLSTVLSEATGMPALEYAKRHLFGPLGIGEEAFWPADPKGNNIGGWSLQLTSRDLAKLGYLYLREGRWGGKQVVPAGWVRDSTAATVPTKSEQASWGFSAWDRYGYQWWGYPGRPEGFSAIGRGGQFVLVWPSLDLVIVATSLEAGAESTDWDLRRLLEEFVLPAVKR